MNDPARVSRRPLLRCPACGQAIDTPHPTRCPLCAFDFGDDRATGADITPYARGYAYGGRAWHRMCEWVWFAGGKRLNHLALMRASAASRRFAAVHVLCLAAALGLFQATRVGWRWVTDSPAVEPTGSTVPAGRGWLHIAAAPRPLPPLQPPETRVDLWWNPAQMVIAAITGLAGGLLLLWLGLRLCLAGVQRAHSTPYRPEERMTAAIHYSTAWGVPVIAAAMVLGLRPISYIGTMEQWPWAPPGRGFVLSAAVLAGVGITLWWFWLVRLGGTAPAKTRGRVVAFFALGVPLIVAAASAAWWYGPDWIHGFLFKRLDLRF